MIKVSQPKDNVYSEVIDGVKHIYLTKTIFVENVSSFTNGAVNIDIPLITPIVA